jgi:cyanophycinase
MTPVVAQYPKRSGGSLRKAACILALVSLTPLAVCQPPAQSTPQPTPQASTPYQYFRAGHTADLATTPQAGYALMGGGADQDEAFRWLCVRAHGGDFLVLRATGTNAYNPYIQQLKGCQLNSVSTLILPTREAALSPFAAETIAHAEAIFIAGGDQANYINLWMSTPVQKALNTAIQRGVPIGGTSAGLAVLGEWAYSAQGDKPDDPNLDSQLALNDPLSPRITLVHGFLDIPILNGVITDSHFTKRDRMGRLAVFLARIQSRPDARPDAIIRGIGIDERTALLVSPDGQARSVGVGDVYFLAPMGPIPSLTAGKPLASASDWVLKLNPGKSFNLRNWCCRASDSYSFTVNDGKSLLFQDTKHSVDALQ